MKKLIEELFYENCYFSLKSGYFGEFSRGLIMEKFERELESHGIELAIDAAHKDTSIEHMGTDAITQLHVRIEVWHEEQASVETLLLDHTQQTVQRAQEDERRLVHHMASPVLA